MCRDNSQLLDQSLDWTQSTLINDLLINVVCLSKDTVAKTYFCVIKKAFKTSIGLSYHLIITLLSIVIRHSLSDEILTEHLK